MDNAVDHDRAETIGDYRDKHYGETCYILGNGPSLKDVDLKSLEYPTFGSNRIYLSGFDPTYYCAVNPLVIQQYFGDIVNIESVKFLPKQFAKEFDAVPIDTSLATPVFTKDATLPMWEGHTVTYVLLQLAYFMGFSEAILLGVDHDFGRVDVPNQELVAQGPDSNHFHPDYFSGGARWNAPDLARSELAYTLAKLAWENDGRHIYNASSKTKLKVFELGNPVRDYQWVSAIVSAYHAEEYIQGCLQDLADQTLKPEMVVVCQAGSVEEKVAQEFKRKGEPVKIVTTPDIPSVYAAWNLGIKACQGEFVTNANTDDRHHPDAFATMVKILDARPEIDLVYHDQFISWGKPSTWQSFVERNLDRMDRLAAGRYEGQDGYFGWANHDLEILHRGCYVGPQPMWRKSLHQLHGYFNEDFKSAGDYEFWLRVAEPDNFFHIPAHLGVYCARMSGVELSNPGLSLDEFNRALTLNQNADGLKVQSELTHVRFEIGNEYCLITHDDAIVLAKKLLDEYN